MGSRVDVVTLRDRMVIVENSLEDFVFRNDTLGARGLSCAVSGVGHVSKRR